MSSKTLSEWITKYRQACLIAGGRYLTSTQMIGAFNAVMRSSDDGLGPCRQFELLVGFLHHYVDA
jgi:hypothetical protein